MSSGYKRTVELLQQLIANKQNLVDKLVEQGGTASMTDSLETLIQKAGQGGSIEVSELPAEGIEGALYKCGDTFYQWETRKILKDIVIPAMPGLSLVNYVEKEGVIAADLTLHYAREIPEQSSINESFLPNNLHLYYFEGAPDVFAYTRPMVDGQDADGNFFPVESEWISLGLILEYYAHPDFTFQGCIDVDTSGSTTLNDGYYACISTEKVWKPYSHSCVIDVDTLPTENIDMNAIYRVIEKKYVGQQFYVPEENMWMRFDLTNMLCLALSEIPMVICNISTLEERPDVSELNYPYTVYYCREDNTLHTPKDGEWIVMEDGYTDIEDGVVTRFILEDDPAYYRPQEEKLVGVVMKDNIIGSCDWIKEGAQNRLGDIIEINFHTLPTTPETTDGVLVGSDNIYHIYYFTDTRTIGTYHNEAETGDIIFTPWSPGDLLTDYPYNGIISDAGDAREAGLYALVQPAWEKCVRPSGITIAVHNNTTVDTREYNSVHVKIAEYGGRVTYG